MQYRSKNSKGLTMIELIVVIGVLVILAVAVFFNIRAPQRAGEARNARRTYDVQSLAKALETYEIDNGQLPSGFSSTTIGIGGKYVLCSSSGTLTCDGQTRGCLVVTDTNFIGKYLPSLPIDPAKTNTADSGYYITRKTGNKIAFGACSPYNSVAIEMVAAAALPTYHVTCGDGNKQGSEVCDDGNTWNEECGNHVKESAGTYCNSTCSAVITIATNEKCDFSGSSICHIESMGWVYESVPGSKWLYCAGDCLQGADMCPGEQ